LAEELRNLRNDARFLRGYSRYLNSKSYERYLELKKTNDILRSLSRQKRSGGQRLTQAAAILLAIPDPVTDFAAVPVLIGAQVMKMRSKKESELQSITSGARTCLTLLASLCEFC